MAVNFTDIYEASNFVRDVTKKHIDIDDEPMAMGIFGYLNEIHANILQNSAQTAAENAMEALPTKAKYIRNILTHANSLSLDTNAVPSVMKVHLFLPEDRVENNLDYKGFFTIDKDFKIIVGDYEFHLDYDIVIRKVTLPDRSTVYTAQYDMSSDNPLSNITSPYIQAIGRFNIDGTNILAIQTQIRQVETSVQEITLTTSNPLVNKTFQFDFSNQLATFNIDVTEGDEKYHLTAVYDGLVDKISERYINYLFLETNTIRCIFKKESYQPRTNCKIAINIYTTHGAEGNFPYVGNITCDLKSDRFNYKGIWMIVKPLSEAIGGEDGKSASELKKLIPTEQLARGSTTNTQDLNNFFNSINTEDRKLYFLPKLDSLERLYYGYLSVKQDTNVIPTNTIDVECTRNQFDNIEAYDYQLFPGNCIFYRRNSTGSIITPYVNDSSTIDDYRSKGFLYFNPFWIVINKNPFYMSYLVNILKVIKDISFEYINQSSPLQFICNDVEWKREYFTDRNVYKLTINLVQNVSTTQFNILEAEDMTTLENVTGANMKVVAVLKNAQGNPYRYAYGDFVSYNDQDQSFVYQFKFITDNVLDKDMNLKIKDLYDISRTYTADGYFPITTDIDIYVLPYLGTDYGRTEEAENIIPGIRGYTLCNKYSIIGGVPLYYNYSKMISTFANLEQGIDENLKFFIKKVPVVAYDYIIDEDRIQGLVEQIELIRTYIDYKLSTIEDGFGVDMKFFNTHGPAIFYNIDGNKDVPLNNTNLSIKCRTKLRVSATDNCINDLKLAIKDYIENYDRADETDLDFSTMQSAIYEQFKDQVYYFEFKSFNQYGPGELHICRDSFESDITKVPEFLCVKVKEDDLPDIDIEVSY